MSAVAFPGPFPEASAFRVELPAGLTDDAGRPLANAARFPLEVRTEGFPPLAKFSARFGILERADPVLPVTLRNLEPEVKARLLRVDGPEPAGAGGGTPGAAGPPQGQPALPPARAGQGGPPLAAPGGGGQSGGLALHRRPTPARPGRSSASRSRPAPSPSRSSASPLERPGLYVVELESARLGAALLGKPQSHVTSPPPP